MTHKRLEQLHKEAEEDLKIDRTDLVGESVRTPLIQNKWLRKLYEAKDRIVALEFEKKKIHKQNWLYYSGKAPDEVYEKRGTFGHRVLKGDLSIFLEADEEMNKIDMKIHFANSEIDRIKQALDECNRRSFHINNALKALKFLNGEI
jgi:hypothetical protein